MVILQFGRDLSVAENNADPLYKDVLVS
jgi:hypothetical protein